MENAAEIALEHHLGMTCDPVRGLVQVPCIERNAFGAQIQRDRNDGDNPGIGPVLSDVRNGYDADYFKACKLIEANALSENQALWNLMVQGEIDRLAGPVHKASCR